MTPRVSGSVLCWHSRARLSDKILGANWPRSFQIWSPTQINYFFGENLILETNSASVRNVFSERYRFHCAPFTPFTRSLRKKI